MKTRAGALLLILMPLLAGCSASFKGITYDSPDGKTCLTKCENARWACRDACGASTLCANDCEEAAKKCRKNCPVTSEVQPENTY